MYTTPIYSLGSLLGNELCIKRDDLLPFSFGGNKARKAELFFEVIDSEKYDCVVTYGSKSSNHCRIISNLCCKRGLECYIVSPQELSEPTFNSKMMSLFGAEITVVPVNNVHDTIESKLNNLKSAGKKPYFIEGGGHGNIGTEAYVRCYHEITEFEKKHETYFDYIFVASGTGTTQAGLICGQLLDHDERSIIGISIARKNPNGRNVVLNSVRSYLGDKAVEDDILTKTIFIDDYTSGYGKDDRMVTKTIEYVLKTYGIPLDTTYTGKAFMGMSKYLEHKQIVGKNILFIHTGGTPLFFDVLNKSSYAEM